MGSLPLTDQWLVKQTSDASEVPQDDCAASAAAHGSESNVDSWFLRQFFLSMVHLTGRFPALLGPPPANAGCVSRTEITLVEDGGAETFVRRDTIHFLDFGLTWKGV